MTLAPGARLGPYQVTAKLGEGGMGQVFQAKDFQLGRSVALKVLPEGFANDPERLQRFEREAKLLAQLNHPNIAQIYGFEASGDTRALVMELVEGPTLAERLEQGPFPFNESLSVSLQVAQALEEAHEKGIVHRDLKPQNIKASMEGKVKVLDFGLAKAMDPSGGTTPSASALAHSPTLTIGATVEGVILGTAAYMAPEQARGLPVDKRADIWAFGVVLFEMLTGRRLFAGDHVTDVLAGVLKNEIDFSSLPAETPAAVRRLLRRCLERNPKLRLRDIGEARVILTEAAAGGNEATDERHQGSNRQQFAAPRVAWTIAAIATVAALVLAGLLLGPAGRAPAVARTSRTSILFPQTLVAEAIIVEFALSPAGDAVALTGLDESGRERLWVRELSEPQARLLAGTEGASTPFWSPDGREIGFFADKKLLRIPREGGSVRTVCDAEAGAGAAWAPDGTILLGAIAEGPLLRVAASGGRPEPATRAGPGELHRFPSLLPDGRHFLFGALKVADQRVELRVGSLDQVEISRRLLEATSCARFAPPNRIVYSLDEALLAQELDLHRLETVGAPVLLSDRPEDRQGYLSQPRVDVAADGSMLYLNRDERPGELVWLDRNARELSAFGRNDGQFNWLNLAPRENRVLMTRAARGDDISLWMFDFGTGALSRVSRPGEKVRGGAWSRDGRELAAAVFSDGRLSLVWIDVENGRKRTLVPDLGNRLLQITQSSPDGRTLFAIERTSERGLDIVTFRIDGDAVREQPYLATRANEVHVFPLGDRWVGYVSDASGRPELLLDSFPEPGHAVRVSTGGDAIGGYWCAKSSELLYLIAEGGKLYVDARKVQLAPSLQLGAPQRLYELSLDGLFWSPTSDGQRSLVLRRVGAFVPDLTLVSNWSASVGKRN